MPLTEWCLFQHAKCTNVTLWANCLVLDVNVFDVQVTVYRDKF